MLPMFLKLFSRAKPPPDDPELVRLYRETGDMAHLGELFQRHTETVYLVCLKYLRDEEESKDAAMQLFEHLATALLKHEIAHFRGWLHVTARNHCLQLLRERKRREGARAGENTPPLMEIAPAFHPMEAEDPERDGLALQEGMAGLPPEQRECLELFYLQQKSYKEITALTGCEPGKVKSHIQNGKRNLRIYLEKHHAPR